MDVRLPTDYTVSLKHRLGVITLLLPRDFIFSWRGVIWVPKKIELSSISVDVLMRELAHMAQQAYLGKFTWLFKYIFSKSFRLKQEIEAYAYQLKFIISPVRRELVIDEAAILFSTDFRLKCASYDIFYSEIMERYTREKISANFTVKSSLLDNDN